MKTMLHTITAFAARLVPTVAFLVLCAPALAQQDGRVSGEDKGILQWVIAIGIIVLTGVIAFMNPKRSHQD